MRMKIAGLSWRSAPNLRFSDSRALGTVETGSGLNQNRSQSRPARQTGELELIWKVESSDNDESTSSYDPNFWFFWCAWPLPMNAPPASASKLTLETLSPEEGLSSGDDDNASARASAHRSIDIAIAIATTRT